MTYAVVSILDHPDHANAVMNNLKEAGYNPSNIETIKSDPESQSFFKRVFTKEGGEEMEAEKAMEFMTGLGIPEDEADDYADQVKKGKSLVLVHCESESEAERAREIIGSVPLEEERHEEGERLEREQREERLAGEERLGEERLGEERLGGDERLGARERGTGMETGAETPTGEERVQAGEEELRVGKEEIETGGVRVQKETTEEEVEKEVSLKEEDVKVERRDVDRPLKEGDQTLGEDEEIVVSETREEPVVDKEPRVREEVVISKETEEHPETIKETVRREHINIDELTERAKPRYEQFESDLRTHHQEHYGDEEMGFDDYSRGYRYGMALAEDERYRGKNWNDVEDEASREWESQEASSWDNFKEAVRYGWHRIRGDEEEYKRRPPQ